MPFSVGDKLGHYEVLSLIGQGGMGEVYRARDTTLKRDVALKVLPATFLRDPDRMARFQREAEVLASLDHPNIGHIHGIVDSEESRGLVLALIEGMTLADRIEAGPIPLDETVAISKQIIEALEYAHDRGVVHRDLKPANVKITPDGVVKVLDFGLAKVLEDEPPPSSLANSPTLTLGHTRTGVILGTVSYMSPEQAVGRPVDRRSDIFSFGAVLYEMLTGKRAFTGATTPDVLEAVVKNDPDWSKLPAGTPGYLRRLLGRTLVKDRKQRLQAIGEARITLANPRVDEPSAAFVPSTSPSGLEKLAVIAAGVLAVAAAALGFGLYRATRPAELRPLMRLDANVGSDAVVGADSSVAISPDGTRIVFPILGADGKQLLATRLLDQSAIAPLPGTENGSDAFFSPDGQWIGFYASRALKKVSLRGGAPVTLYDQTALHDASWGENGDIVASVNIAGGLQGISASGGSLRSVTNLGKQEVTHRWPQVLSGGNNVVFTAATTSTSFEDANIEVVSLKTGALKTLLSGGYFGRYLPTNGATGHLVYVHQGALYAVGFDPVRLEVRGSPERILEDVAGMTGAGGLFDFSRNGTFVYRPGSVADQKWPVVWLNDLGKIEPLVTALGNYAAPRFSPDGKRLALTANTAQGQEIFVYDRQRDALSRLTFSGGQIPVWSRDGEHLVFESRNAAGSRLSWIRADGSGEIQVLLESKSNLLPSDFSPDGRRLAYFELKSDGDMDIWTLPLDTSDPEHLKPGKPALFLQTPAAEAQMFFSPDGRYVAYQSNESGRYEIYVRPAPGPDGKPGPGRWQVSTAGGAFAMWSPNARELFYKSFDNRIMVTDYRATGGSFSSGKPRLWSDRQIRQVGGYLSFAIAPDSKRFAVFAAPEATAADKGAGNVTFLLNFFDELRRKVPVGK